MLPCVRVRYLAGKEEGTSGKFESVQHDGWNSDATFFWEFSISIMDPLMFEIKRMALGLARPDSPTMKDSGEAALEVLGRYGLVKGAVKFFIYDNTN